MTINNIEVPASEFIAATGLLLAGFGSLVFVMCLF